MVHLIALTVLQLARSRKNRRQKNTHRLPGRRQVLALNPQMRKRRATLMSVAACKKTMT
jgi:hypothetical protein